jgi:hypothetical protein
MSYSAAADNSITTVNHEINITTSDDTISVEEIMTLQGDSQDAYNNVSFWISQQAQNVDILINNNKATCTSSGDEYICNVSAFLNISVDTPLTATITYNLQDVEQFKKTITKNTSVLTVEFDGTILYSGNNLHPGMSFSLLLYQPLETPISWYIIVFIILLVILLAVTTLYSLRKQKYSKTKHIASESEELLDTKKKLLMSLLKDLEKQYRSKKISDDTYHTLKDTYKQQTVETMKKLEDKRSSVRKT